MSVEGVVRLRRATPDDEPALAEIFASTRSAEMALMPTAEAAHAFASMQLQFQRQHVSATYPAAVEQVVLNGADAVAGRLIVAELDDSVRLVDIALLPEARGSGIGTALVRGVQERAAALGLPVVLHVEHGLPARRLYERLGFTATAEDQLRTEMRWAPPGSA